MAKQRYELVEGTSSKFWEIEPRGSELGIAWGKIGTAGQSQTKSFADEAGAAAAAAKLIKEKTSKGYTLVSAGAEPSEQPASKTASKPSETASNPSEKASNPSETASKPSETANKPSETADKPSETASKPSSTIGSSSVSLLPDAIVWTAETERLRAEATRTAPPAALPSGDDAALLATVRAWLDANPFTTPTQGYEHFRNRKNLALGRGLADADGARAFDRLLDYADGKLPGSFDPELDGAVIALVMGREARLALTSLLLRHMGVVKTFDALCAVFLFEHGSQNGTQEAFPNWIMRLSDPSHAKGTFGSEPELASLLAHVPEARDELELRAESRRESGSLALRIALTTTFRREDWARADAQRLLTSPVEVTSGYYVASMLTDELVPLAKVRSGHYAPYRPDAIATVARLGFDALPYLAFLTDDTSADFTRVAQALSVLEHPRAAALLATFLEKKGYSSSAVQKEHAAIVQRYFARRPDLAVRALGPIVAGRSKLATKVEPIVKAALRSSPGLLEALGDALEPRVRAHLASFVESPVAAAAPARSQDVPAVLREPPWTRTGDVIPTLSLEITGPYVPLYPDYAGSTTEPTRYYFPSTARVPDGVEPRTEAFDAFFRERYEAWSDWDRGSFLEGCTSAYARRLFETHGAEYFKRGAESFYFRIGNEVWPLVLAEVRDRPSWAIDFARECAEPRLARAFALAFETKSHRARATEWLRRFPEAAARGLLPLVLGTPSKARDAARRALRVLLATHADVVRAVAAGYGPEAASALARLEASPPDVYPKKLPSLPGFLDLAVLPPLVLKAGGALPPEAVKTLSTLLALSPLEEPLVALGEAKEALEPRAAARFAWDLFQQWLAAGANSKELWCFWALGHLGDDESARRLTPLVRAWPGETAHARAVVGLDVLATIGTDVALMHLHGIAQKLKFKGLQEKAREKIAQIAEARGLSPDELAERLVPDLDLDPSGSRTLDFGARTFRVSFDEGLRPVVLDASGVLVGELPKANKSDDAAKAKEATEIWKTLKADAKTIASGQIARLEQMMCTERRTPAAAFRLFFLEHPLLVHLVRRLLWGVYDDAGRLVASFRVAEDRSLADANDAAFTLPEDARVGVVHRLHLSDALAATWGSVFADYQIIAPFEQLGRVVKTMTDAERASSRLARGDFDAKTGAVLGLESRGWRKGENEQGVILSMIKPVGAGLVVEMPIADGIYLGYAEGTGPTQRITHQRLLEARAEVPFSRLGAVASSELLRDLESLR